MTSAVLVHTDWAQARSNGSSVFLNRSAKDSTRMAPIQRGAMPSTAVDLRLSTGVTGSASIVQQMTNDLIGDIRDWLILSDVLPQVEREVVALLPPNRHRVVTVHVRYAGKARPLISLDDIVTEVDPD